MQNPWWRNLVWLFVAFVIAGAIKFIYQETAYKRKIPIENSNPEWQFMGPTTMVYEGKNYSGKVYFDRTSVEKKEHNISLWMKFTADEPIIQHLGGKAYRWNEQIAGWTVDCENKKIKMNYCAIYLEGKKQFSEKLDDVDFPIIKGTTSYTLFESFCF